MMGIINEDSNMRETIFDMINEAVEGADLYEHEGLIWLIFTDENEWIIKLNEKGTLLYRHKFFNIIFKYLSLDVIENQHYITEWVEDTIKNRVKYTFANWQVMAKSVEDTIKNGVKYTWFMGGLNLHENINRIQEMMGIINEDSNMREIIFDIINDEVKGADLYEHEGSLWLIFTDDKKWVLEITEGGTLRYNYNFFNSIFKYLSLDVVENQHYITEWVEDTIQNGIKISWRSLVERYRPVEDTIQNGIKIGNIKNG
jgi:hypothetical protein